MERIVSYTLQNFKKLLYIGILIEVLCFLYCWPVTFSNLLLYLVKNVVLSLVLALMTHGAKLNNMTGATKLFSRIKWVKYTELFFILFMIIASIIGIIVTLKTRDLQNSCMILPTVIGMYSASRAVRIYEHELKENEYG